MLVLTRKIGEALEIGGEISLVVLEVSGGKVRLGISGPRDIAIRRGELKARDALATHGTVTSRQDLMSFSVPAEAVLVG